MADILIYLLLNVVIFYNILNSIKILVEQYYSLSRMYKCKISTISSQKSYYLACTIFILGGLLLFYLGQNYFSYFMILLANCLLIVEISLKNYQFTRRNLLLLSISLIISGIISYFVFFHVSSFLAVLSVLIISNISLILAFVLLFPIEKLIQNYYINKARKKVKENNYIVIGITGSFGKTTTKNFIYSLLKNKYLISRQDHNYNTLMGLCKYINNEVRNEDEILLVELGVDKLNSMKKFGRLFQLDYAIITSIGEMHLSTFKNINNIVKEKLSIKNLLKKNGKILIDKEIVDKYRNKINFPYAYYSYEDINYTGESFFKIKYGEELVETNLISKYQVSSLSCAIKISKILNLSKDEILFGIKNLIIPLRRCSIYYYKNLTIIDNSYNGNIDGINEIVKSIYNYEKKKVVITGGLVELGDKYYVNNFSLGQKLSNFDMVIFVGHESDHPLLDALKDNSNLICVSNLKEAYNELSKIEEETIVLLLAKGSDIYLK